MNVGLLESNRTRLARWALGFSALVVCVAAGAIAVHPIVLALLPMAMIFGGLLALMRLSGPREVVHQGSLSATAEGVRVGSQLTLSGPLREALLMPNQREGVVLRLKGSSIWPTDVTVSSIEEGRALLSALGLDASRRTAEVYVRGLSVEEYRARSRLALVFPLALIGTVVATIIFMTPLLVFGFLAVFPFLLAIMLSLAVHGRATVGTDGVLVRHLGRRRFIPLDGVADAELGSAEPIMNTTPLVVRLLDHERKVMAELLVDCKQDAALQEGLAAEADARAEALVERLREVLLARAEGGLSNAARALRRRERDARDWIAALRAIHERTETFRDGAPPTLSALLLLVEDGAAPAELRAAAAVAAAAAAPDVRARIRVAATASAEPRLRIALEAAAENDDARLSTALDELDAAMANRARST